MAWYLSICCAGLKKQKSAVNSGNQLQLSRGERERGTEGRVLDRYLYELKTLLWPQIVYNQSQIAKGMMNHRERVERASTPVWNQSTRRRWSCRRSSGFGPAQFWLHIDRQATKKKNTLTSRIRVRVSVRALRFGGCLWNHKETLTKPKARPKS